MNSLICLALSSLLVGLLYVFMRQLFAAQDRKISDLTELVASVVTELQQQTLPPSISPPTHASLPAPALEVKRLPERVTVSDDSESESDSDDDSSTTNESDSEDGEEVKKNVLEKAPETEEVQVETVLTNEVEIEDISITLDLSDSGKTKTINLFETVEPVKPNYEKMTVKELKELVAKQGGPGSLKTKKELIDFLEKKI